MTTLEEKYQQLLTWAPYLWSTLTAIVGLLVWLVPKLIVEGRKREAERAEMERERNRDSLSYSLAGPLTCSRRDQPGQVRNNTMSSGWLLTPNSE